MQNILIGLGVAVAVGGGVYVYTSGNTQINEETTGEQESTRKDASKSRDFRTILSSGENVRCTFSHEENGNHTEGTIYMADSGERISGHFVMTGTMDTEMHIIRDNETSYMWGPAFSEGIKVAVTEDNRDVLFESDTDAAIPENVTYTCDSWRVDNSKFTVPSDVTFVDMQAHMDAMMQGMPSEGSADIRAMQCGTCDQAGSAREQCRTALGCDS